MVSVAAPASAMLAWASDHDTTTPSSQKLAALPAAAGGQHGPLEPFAVAAPVAQYREGCPLHLSISVHSWPIPEKKRRRSVYAASAQEHEPTDHHSMNEAAHINCPTYDPPSPGWVRLQRTTLNICYNNTVPVATSSGPCQYCGAAIAKRAGAPTALDAVSTLYTAANAWTDPFSVAAGLWSVTAGCRTPTTSPWGCKCRARQLSPILWLSWSATRAGRSYTGRAFCAAPSAPFYISNDPHGQRRWRLTCTRTEASVFLGLLLDVDTRPGTAVIIVYLNPVHTEHHRHPSLDGPATDAAGVAPAPPLDPNCFPPGPASHRAIRAILRHILRILTKSSLETVALKH